MDIAGFASRIAKGFASDNLGFTYSTRILKDFCRPGWLM